MTTFDTILRELRQVPEPILREVLDFLRFLRSRADRDSFNGAAASESALADDWNLPEEDEAWRNL